MIRITTVRTLLFGAFLALAACSGKPDAQAPLNEGTEAAADNNAEENLAAETTAPITAAQPQVTEQPNTSESANVASTTPSEQIRDDADATGMTARLPDSGETAPVDKAEVK